MVLDLKKKIALYLAAFLVPPILVGTLFTISTISEVMIHRNPEPIQKELPAPASLDSDRQTVLIVLSNVGTELMDFLAPYEIFSASGKFNVITAAPIRQLSPTTGPVYVLPDYELEKAPKAEIIIIPAVLDPGNPEVQNWIKAQAQVAHTVISLGEGARLTAQARLLDQKKVTTHFIAARDVQQMAPTADIQLHQRYLKDGNMISGAGIAASIDTSLFALRELTDETTYQKTVQNLGVPAPHAEQEVRRLNAGDYFTLLAHAAFDWTKPHINILLYPSVSEIALGAYLESLTRSFSAHVTTVSNERDWIKTGHGLYLVAQQSLAESGLPDVAVIPTSSGLVSSLAQGQASAPVQSFKDWATTQQIKLDDRTNTPVGQAWLGALTLLVEQKGNNVARIVSTITQYPEALAQSTKSQSMVWLRIPLLGLLGVLLMRLIVRGFSRGPRKA